MIINFSTTYTRSIPDRWVAWFADPRWSGSTSGNAQAHSIRASTHGIKGAAKSLHYSFVDTFMLAMSADTNTPSLPDVAAVNGVVRPRRLSSAKISAQCPKGELAPLVIQVRKEMLDSIENEFRHSPIHYCMFKYDGIRPISYWVNTYQNHLYPWGGPYRFMSGATCENGPVFYPDSE
jgi:hypothetical protein